MVAADIRLSHPIEVSLQRNDSTLTKQSILFLNRCYWPDSEATGQLLTDLCKDLAESFDIHVICGQPNSPTTDSFTRSGLEVRDGVSIHRLRHFKFSKRVPAGRLLNLFSFSLAANKYLRKQSISPDVVICETDPFLLPIVANRFIKRQRSEHYASTAKDVKFVCYLQDIYPDVAEAIGKVKSGTITNSIRSQLQASYRSADRVVVLGQCMKSRLTCEPWAIDPDRMKVIPNWADCDSIKPITRTDQAFRQKHGLDDQFVVMHSGNMGLTQRLDVLVNATKDPNWPSNAVLLLVGDGASRLDLLKLAENSPHGRVQFLPYQPREQLSESLSAADLHVVSMHENIIGCLCPSKLYGILAAGRPVLGIASEQTDLVQTIVKNEVGFCCEPGQPAKIATLVQEAANNQETCKTYGNQARLIARQYFDRPVVTAQFREMIDSLSENVQNKECDTNLNKSPTSATATTVPPRENV